jgi:hypothetical protein
MRTVEPTAQLDPSVQHLDGIVIRQQASLKQLPKRDLRKGERGDCRANPFILG